MRKMSGLLVVLGSVMGAVGVGCVYLGVSDRMMKLILGRKNPKNMERGARLVSGSNMFSEYAQEISVASTTLEEGGGFQEVSVLGGDGVRLVGHWHPHPNPQRVIIAMHGWRSTWSRDFGFIADFWFQNRCSVLFAEQRGQSNSGGKYMGFGMLERHDCLRWIDWVEKKTGGELPLYLWGISMGASTVLMASGLNPPPSVHGIIADCGFTSPHAIWKHVTEKNLHLPYLVQGVLANQWCRRRLRVGSKECSACDALKGTSVPVLFIHGTEDKFVPVEMTYENYKACASPKRLFIVPGAQHGMSYHIDRPGYQKAVRDFWTDFDPSPPPVNGKPSPDQSPSAPPSQSPPANAPLPADNFCPTPANGKLPADNFCPTPANGKPSAEGGKFPGDGV